MQEFVKAVIAYHKKANSLAFVPRPPNIDAIKLEKEKAFTGSISISKEIYKSCQWMHSPNKELGLKAKAGFFEVTKHI